MTSKNSIIQSRVSIGLPVYNGEKFIRKKLDSILAQTFTNFELIISDNASTDSTAKICEEYSKKDKRIRYIRQKMNIGVVRNYNFVLNEARYEYFLWTAVDDIFLPTFLEKNISILESNKNVVCSISRIQMYGEFTDYLKPKPNDSFLVKLEKQIKTNFSHMDSYPVSGPYETKMKDFLKRCRHSQVFYGVYRTKQLLEHNTILESFLGNDTTFTISLLRYGDLHVIDEVLMYVYDGGISRSGLIGVATDINKRRIGIIFPFYYFTTWCAKHLGKRIFLTNFDFFIKINIVGAISFSMAIIKLAKLFIGRKRHID